MLYSKDIKLIEWNSIKKIFLKKKFIYNHFNFECLAKSNKLKVYLKKCQLFINT